MCWTLTLEKLCHHLFSGPGQPRAIFEYLKQDLVLWLNDRIPSTNPGAEPPRDARDSGSARSHSTHLETSSSNRP